eukprot:14354583-Alexandrium_andersonii.AAC.1
MLRRSVSESPGRSAQLRTTLRGGSRNSSSQWNQSVDFSGPTPRMKMAETSPSVVMSSARREMFGGGGDSPKRPESRSVLKGPCSCLR